MGKNTNKEFEFSIIMATYNSQRYLCESIDSIIKQNIGFENNVQLILVDDGSTDNSNICFPAPVPAASDLSKVLEQEPDSQSKFHRKNHHGRRAGKH
jgi:GT2 family glycosyltransferase